MPFKSKAQRRKFAELLVNGKISDEQYEEFFRSVPEFEKMLTRSGIQLVKYWFST